MLTGHRRGDGLQLNVCDPAERWPASFRELLRQMRDIVLHEFWMAQDRPERSPGARWVRLVEIRGDASKLIEKLKAMSVAISRVGVSARDVTAAMAHMAEVQARGRRG